MGDAQQCAFETLRRLVCEAPICSVPIPSRPFLLHTDTSAAAVGCMLSQLDDEGIEHPVDYASHKLSPAQCAWSVIECETFAIVWTLGRFRNVIFCSHVTIYTDHNPLSYLCNSAPKRGELSPCRSTICH